MERVFLLILLSIMLLISPACAEKPAPPESLAKIFAEAVELEDADNRRCLRLDGVTAITQIGLMHLRLQPAHHHGDRAVLFSILLIQVIECSDRLG